MEEPSNNVLNGFAYHLAERQLLSKDIALDAIKQAELNQNSYIHFLIKQKLVDETQIAWAVAEYFGLPLCDIDAFDKESLPREYLNIQLVRKHLGLPLIKKNNCIFLAITDPTIEHLYELRFLTGLDVRFFVVESGKLTQLIDELLNTLILSEIDSTFNDDQLTKITINAYKEDDIPDLAAFDIESAPVVNYVNKILLNAIEKGASDIHFERYESMYRIRFRQQGILYPITSPPTKIANYLLARIKVMSSLDITEHRLPQDGRFKLIISRKRSVDFRVSVCPTLFGEKIVLRILDQSNVLQGIPQLGMEPIQQEHFLNALQRSQGMILVTGPTGSGKTITLYSGLNYLNSTEKNISTVEDPVEIPMQGINQVHVNPKVGLTFAAALRSFLRQDPDIIMVGEIRDFETAEIAVKAAQTGHLVLSTLHTNSAAETLTRLISMGIEPYNLATAVALIIAQRLIRKLCENCKTKLEIPKEILIKEGFSEDEIESLILYGPTGCDHCIQGYKDRIGIFEVMPISFEMNNLIMQGASAIQIMQLSQQEGIVSLRGSGIKKVKEGITSLAELNRVFK